MKRRDKGQVLVLVALAIFVLLGFAALGIDVGFMYSVRHELQRSADAGALAGASRWIEVGSQWSSNPSDPVMVASRERAKDYAIINKVAPTPLDRLTEVAVDFPSQDRIRVTTQRTAPLFFARVLGRDNQVISATAVAEAAVADTGVKCLKPWGIPIPWNDVNGDGKYDSGDGPAPDNLDLVPLGTKLIIKVAEPFNKKGQLDLPSLQQESGHFFALDLCGDRGANDYMNRITGECDPNCSVALGDNLVLEPGNMVGPTKHGVQQLIDSDPGVWNEGTKTVDGSSSDPYTKSRRFVHIPVYDPEQMLHHGRVEMTVVGFAGFWISGFDSKQGTVTGYYVPDTSPAGAGGVGPGPGPVLRILRLVE